MLGEISLSHLLVLCAFCFWSRNFLPADVEARCCLIGRFVCVNPILYKFFANIVDFWL